MPHFSLSAMDLLRPRKSFADYAAVAICPALLVLLVGSLVFFLVEIGYGGTHLGKLRWTLFWFVLAMVLVSRIAIEKGYDHAGIYAFGLAVATGLVVTQYVSNFLGVWCILGLIWWATNKLTWDCTLIDEEVDASGEGLLQAARLDNPDEARGAEGRSEDAGSGQATGTTGRTSQSKGAKPRWWKAAFGRSAQVPAKPHAPGIWVLYFSLAALPVFGLGEALIPLADSTARDRAFAFVLIYVAAALGLLLITSFLGLRRYLRQRRLTMPRKIAGAWVSFGAGLGAVILVGCILVPRPNARWTFGAMVDRLGDPGRKPSSPTSAPTFLADQSSTTPGGQGDQAGRGSQAAQQAQSGQTNQGAHAQEEASTPGVTSSQPSQPGSQGRIAGNGPPKPGATGQSQPGAAVPRPDWLRWIKIAFYALIVSLGVLLLIKNHRYVLLTLAAFWKILQALWARLWRREPRVKSFAAPRLKIPPTPFASFANPFNSDLAERMAPHELVVYTFEALAAWAEGYHCGRAPEQTPMEFAVRVADELPDVAVEVPQVARLYAQVAYAGGLDLPPCRSLLEILWTKMTREHAPPLAS